MERNNKFLFFVKKLETENLNGSFESMMISNNFEQNLGGGTINRICSNASTSCTDSINKKCTNSSSYGCNNSMNRNCSELF
jgi:hypothetical protein